MKEETHSVTKDGETRTIALTCGREHVSQGAEEESRPGERSATHLLWSLGGEVSADVRADKALAEVREWSVAQQSIDHGHELVCSLLRARGRMRQLGSATCSARRRERGRTSRV